MGIVRVHIEADNGVPPEFFVSGDREMCKEVTVWELATERGRESVEGVGNAGNTDIH